MATGAFAIGRDYGPRDIICGSCTPFHNKNDFTVSSHRLRIYLHNLKEMIQLSILSCTQQYERTGFKSFNVFFFKHFFKLWVFRSGIKDNALGI